MKYLIRRDTWGNVTLKRGRTIVSDYSRVRDAVRGAKRDAKRLGLSKITVKTIDTALPFVAEKELTI